MAAAVVAERRALGNRGNARTRQGKLDAALGDLNAAIKLCPWAVDPVLNRCSPRLPPAACRHCLLSAVRLFVCLPTVLGARIPRHPAWKQYCGLSKLFR